VNITLLATGCGNTSTIKTITTMDSQSTVASSLTQPIPTPTEVNGTLQVHYIDVGQADSILIKTSGGTAVLIDGGNNPDGLDVVNYLKSQQVKELAAVIATHR